MSKFKNCPIIEVGDVFTRVDKNGKVWEAKVINRTEYFVDVEKKSPYQVKICDEEPIREKRFYNGAWHFKYVGGVFHYEDPKPTIERCMIHRIYEEVEDGEKDSIWGKIKKYKKVPTARYILDVKENYIKSNNYDFNYSLVKYGDGVNEPEDAEKGIDLFYKYCEEN